MCSGNAAYMYLSLSFVQILKAFTPAVTLFVCSLAGQERLTPALLVSVSLVALGTGGAVWAEKLQIAGSKSPATTNPIPSSLPSGSKIEDHDLAATARWWYGLFLFAVSSVSEASRVVGAQALQTSLYRFTSSESLTYIGLPTAATLLICALLFEGSAAVQTGLSLGLLKSSKLVEAVAAALKGTSNANSVTATVGAVGTTISLPSPSTFLMAFLMSLFVNLTCLMAIKASSSLTFKIASCIKNVAVVAYGVVVHADKVTPIQMVGYSISVAGFTMYSHLKLKLMNAKQKTKADESKKKA
eukprot:CAMPEP_0175058952 /NCGR_PEP_ID=MMETSP0052_2-20121109/12147_1 /TAXON_ID=51329 ORGANISM="Polytomella parva, Strain SAG 63-3" /NCGR_SAMPLE_ID=MMETSP0052_2 /ASSEMBLY_ACC=CAM_ASM_000194 /LENGTH=299 /DNA_ID=CAMNT_0016324417 /DNA_START=343 /DNA_END=1242 /DNA_ORIENTATION=+